MERHFGDADFRKLFFPRQIGKETGFNAEVIGETLVLSSRAIRNDQLEAVLEIIKERIKEVKEIKHA